jgi:predicted secreted protein
MKRGQYIRLFLSTTANPSKVVAAAKEMSLHLSAQTEDSSTKDTTGDWLEYEVTGQSYDISFNALVLSPDDSLGGNTANTLNDFETNLKDDVLYWKIATVNGTNNRTAVQTLFSGTAKLTQLQINAQNKQNATYSGTLNGYGAITIAEIE